LSERLLNNSLKGDVEISKKGLREAYYAIWDLLPSMPVRPARKIVPLTRGELMAALWGDRVTVENRISVLVK
jgi:hypothetical protein